MISTSTKIYTIILFVVILLLTFFGFMWHNSSKNLNKAKEDLIEARSTINSLQSDVQDLMLYITERDDKIKDLENKYKSKMNNIPADKCGDAKPSAELLKYLREEIEQ